MCEEEWLGKENQLGKDIWNNKYRNEVLEEGLELHPLKEQQENVADWRQIGLGIMGLADMLILLGITIFRDGCKRIGILNMEEKPKAVSPVNQEKVICPDCGESIVFEGGCNICKNRGWSKCR